jgi:hypothetical protein
MMESMKDPKTAGFSHFPRPLESRQQGPLRRIDPRYGYLYAPVAAARVVRENAEARQLGPNGVHHDGCGS